MHRRSLMAVLGVLLAFTAMLLHAPIPVAAAGITIDTFSTEQYVMQFTTGTSSNSLPDLNVLGGERDLNAVVTSGTSWLILQSNSVESYFSYIAGPVLGTGDIVWDGTDDNGSVVDIYGLGGIPLNTEGVDRFQVEVVTADHAGAILKITVWDMNGNSDTVASDALPIVPTGSPQIYPFLFEDFDEAVDLSNVGALMLTVDATAVLDLDMAINFIETNGPATAVKGLSLGSASNQSLLFVMAGAVVLVGGSGALVVTRAKGKHTN